MESAILFIIITLIIVFLWLKSKHSYWKSRGVPTPPYSFPMGNMKNSILHKCSIADDVFEIYEKLKNENYGGMYYLLEPMFVPLNLELVKSIMVVDIHHFVDRGIYFNEKSDPLSAHLFNLEGAKWKLLRRKLTPTFTSGKTKMMFPTIEECTSGLTKVINSQNGEMIDVKDVLDIIGKCAFGIERNTLDSPKSLFRERGMRILQRNRFENFIDFLAFSMPDLMKFFNDKVLPSDVAEFFMDIVRETVNHREKNNISKIDFMQLLIQLKNRGQLVDDNKIFKESLSEKNNRISIEEIAAQALVFFLAGFETSSTTMTFCLYELSKNKDIQDKIRDEIATVLTKFDRNVTYEAVGEMKYLEQVIEETLRKYPPLPALNRVCTKDYKVPGTDLILKKGMAVMIPVIGIHYDPKYFPEPDQFDPERFSEQNKKTRPPFSYLPFGEGPRVCIGTRFGMIQSKVGLISLLKNYEISLNTKTREPIQFEPESFVISTKGGIWLDFKKLSN